MRRNRFSTAEQGYSAMRSVPLATDWHCLAEDQQLQITHAALLLAMEIIAGRSEVLAEAMEHGEFTDCGGPDALRLLATTLRAAADDHVLAAAAASVGASMHMMPAAGNA
jgi:hypothetical protein